MIKQKKYTFMIIPDDENDSGGSDASRRGLSRRDATRRDAMRCDATRGDTMSHVAT